jgi:hypothetical protein
MELIPDIDFAVGEQYENEKGVFTVVSIDKQNMIIRWKGGETITTDIDLQNRIQKRKKREKMASEEKPKAKKSRPRKIA